MLLIVIGKYSDVIIKKYTVINTEIVLKVCKWRFNVHSARLRRPSSSLSLLSLSSSLHLLVLCHHHLDLLLWASSFSPLAPSFPEGFKTSSVHIQKVK